MKLLLDENLPKKLKTFFSPTHEVYTFGDMGWNGKKNGELLKLLHDNLFEGLITIDKNLTHQQNLSLVSFKIIVLDAKDNKLDTLKPYIDILLVKLGEPIETNVLNISLEG